MDSSFVGREFPLTEPYSVGAEKVREFAAAIGEQAAVCHSREAATAAGYPDLVAPPTFGIAVIARAQDAVLFNPELGLDFARVVHGDQRFVQHRPIVAGDALTSVVHIDSIRVMAGNDIIGLRTEVSSVSGDAVCTAFSTLVSRAAT
jgi:acyl dehydratase